MPRVYHPLVFDTQHETRARQVTLHERRYGRFPDSPASGGDDVQITPSGMEIRRVRKAPCGTKWDVCEDSKTKVLFATIEPHTCVANGPPKHCSKRDRSPTGTY